jgi:hypothetical protein
MKKNSLLITSGFSIIAVIIGLLAITHQVSAASTTAGSGEALEIGPPVLNLTADPGQTITADISIRDVSSTPLLVKGVINDFVAGDENGTPKILLDSDETSAYSIKNWIAPISSLTLTPHQIITLPVKIVVPANASPGGHYGVIRFTGTPPSLSGSGVALSASLGALILMRINGDITEHISVAEFSANTGGSSSTFFEAAPITFVARLDNTGNIHEQPAGLITITDMFGKNVDTLSINQPPHDILPSSIRKFTAPLDSTSIGNKILFGRYHAQLSVTYGTGQKPTTADFYFWVIPYRLIGLGIIVLVGGFLLIRYLIIRYNRSLLRRSGRSRRY